MRKSNFALQLSAVARFSASPEACTMYSVQATTPQLARDPEREEVMPSKCPQVPATAVEARTSAASPETAQKAANPASVIPLSARNIVNISSISASVRVPTSSHDLASAHSEANIPLAICDIFCTDSSSPRSARAVSHHVHETASALFQASIPCTSRNITCIAPASVHDTASPSCKVRDTISIPVNSPHSTRDTSRVPPSVRFSVPKHPQSAPQVPHTTDAISSQPRSLRSRSSRCTSACTCQHVQYPPPVLFRTPFPRFTQSANPHDEAHCTQPSSNEQSANRHRVTATQLLFHPHKPLDMVHQACAMLARF